MFASVCMCGPPRRLHVARLQPSFASRDAARWLSRDAARLRWLSLPLLCPLSLQPEGFSFHVRSGSAGAYSRREGQGGTSVTSGGSGSSAAAPGPSPAHVPVSPVGRQPGGSWCCR
jgi:hypothetical protein